MSDEFKQEEARGEGLGKRNRRVAYACLGFLATMFGLAYAAVPLYSWFCRTTGFAGTPLIASAPPAAKDIDKSKTITVRFDANTNSALPWKFEPVSAPAHIHLGEPYLATFRATNLSDRATVGTAAFNVTPQQVGGFFVKTECFCFTEQKLGPRESEELTVSFYVEPDLAADANLGSLDTITLSYTFFPARQQVGSAATPSATASIR